MCDKEIGYTQGMNFIVGVILCTLINYGEATTTFADNPQTNYS